jgi:hypothetical protein
MSKFNPETVEELPPVVEQLLGWAQKHGFVITYPNDPRRPGETETAYNARIANAGPGIRENIAIDRNAQAEADRNSYRR